MPEELVRLLPHHSGSHLSTWYLQPPDLAIKMLSDGPSPAEGPRKPRAHPTNLPAYFRVVQPQKASQQSSRLASSGASRNAPEF